MYYDVVREFHESFNHPAPGHPVPLDEHGGQYLTLRETLIREEYEEVLKAIDNDDPANLTEELADMLVVIFGFAVAYGLPIEEMFEAKMRANMSKLGEDGKPIFREDGKILKGPNYKPCNAEKVYRNATLRSC